MRRLLWAGVGAAATVATLRKVREVTDRHVPAGARSALGAAAGATTLVQRAVAEFRAGTAEREAELRADLLAGADLTRSRARVDAWRAERAERAGRTGGHRPDDDRPHADARGDDARDADGDRPAGSGRPGSAAAARNRRGSGAHRAEDPDDGALGYSFF